MDSNDGLCFRCEKRALFLEKKRPPYRYQCGLVERTGYSCYAFTPIKPILMKKSLKDRRPISLNVFGARVMNTGDPNMVMEFKKTKKGLLVYWRPFDQEVKEKMRKKKVKLKLGA